MLEVTPQDTASLDNAQFSALVERLCEAELVAWRLPSGRFQGQR